MVVAVVVLGVLLAAATAGLGTCVVRLRAVRRRIAALEAATTEPVRRRPPRSVRVAERAVRTVVGTAVRVREQGVGGMLMSSLDDLSRWAMEDRGEIARLAAEDGNVTVLFTDIEGSTSLNDTLGDEDFVRLLIAHDTIVRLHVDRRRGHVVKTQGDGFMVVFGKPSHAVKAGLDIQRSFAQPWTHPFRRTPIRVRIGVHTGPVVARGDDFFGLTVAVAARVGAAAGGGETLVSQEVADQLVTDTRFTLSPPREVELRGVPGRRRLYAVRRAPRLPQRTAG